MCWEGGDVVIEEGFPQFKLPVPWYLVGEGKSGCGRRLTERKTPPFQGKSLIVSILDSDCDACKPLGVS